MKKKIISALLSAVLLLSVFTVTASAGTPSSWARSEVVSAIQEGLVPSSLTDNYTWPITRSEFCELAMLLYKKISQKEIPSGQTPFSDIDTPYATAAFNLGIVNGIAQGIFAPSNHITRQEICTMLSRTAKAAVPELTESDSPNTFPDIASIADWALPSVKYMNIKEIMFGDDKNRINPLGETSREQAILLSLRTAKAFATDSTDFLASYGFISTGNTSSNMLNGSFAVNYTDGELYLHDNNGIRTLTSKDYLVNTPVDYMYVDATTIYYISSVDKKLYMYNFGNSTPLCDIPAKGIALSDGFVYFSGAEDSQIYRVPEVGGNATKITDDSNEYGIPISTGKYIVFSATDGIYSFDSVDNTLTGIYKGFVSDFCYKNNTYFFKNESGNLCSVNTSGNDYSEITQKPCQAYCIYQSGIALAEADGLYKTNFSGSFHIMIDSGNYKALNSYNNYIYALSSDGRILKLKNDCSEKSYLN